MLTIEFPFADFKCSSLSVIRSTTFLPPLSFLSTHRNFCSSTKKEPFLVFNHFLQLKNYHKLDWAVPDCIEHLKITMFERVSTLESFQFSGNSGTNHMISLHEGGVLRNEYIPRWKPLLITLVLLYIFKNGITKFLYCRRSFEKERCNTTFSFVSSRIPPFKHNKNLVYWKFGGYA